MTDENLTDRQIEQRLAGSSRRLAVPMDLDAILDRMEAELSPHKSPRVQWRRLAVASLALAVAGAGLFLASQLLGADTPTPAAHPTTYFLQLPKAAPQERTGDVYVFEVLTNLPEGTLSQVHLENPEFTSPVCCPEVHNGRIRIELEENPCVLEKGVYRGTRYRIQMTVLPVVETGLIGCPIGGTCPRTRGQPPSVLARLGSEFQYVRGEQVTVYHGQRALQTSGEFELASADCTWGPGPGPDPGAHLELTPASGPVGSRIELHGTGFFGPYLAEDAPFSLAFLIERNGCELIASGERSIHIDAKGRLSGYMIVPSRGSCSQQRGGWRQVEPGLYNIQYGCHACTIAQFRVTAR
jgi:hypothetical protein